MLGSNWQSCSIAPDVIDGPSLRKARILRGHWAMRARSAGRAALLDIRCGGGEPPRCHPVYAPAVPQLDCGLSTDWGRAGREGWSSGRGRESVRGGCHAAGGVGAPGRAAAKLGMSRASDEGRPGDRPSQLARRQTTAEELSAISATPRPRCREAPRESERC